MRLRYSSGPRKVKEVLERLRVTGSSRSVWPVLEVGGRIVWMKGVEVEPEQGIESVNGVERSGRRRAQSGPEAGISATDTLE